MDNTEAFLERLQKEQAEWSRRNFGNNPRIFPILGLIEELYEFNDAFHRRDEEDLKDAIGDIVIYMSDACTRYGWNLSLLYRSRENAANVRHSVSQIQGKLAHHALKLEQGIRKKVDHEKELTQLMRYILFDVSAICTTLGEGFQNVVSKTWDRVSKRDWVKNPDTAHEVADGKAEQ